MMLSTLLALVYDMVVRAVWQIFSLVFIVSLALCCFVLQRSLLLCVTEIAVALCYRDRNRWPIFAGLKFVLFFAYWELSNTFI